MCCSLTSRPMISMSTNCARSRRHCSTFPAARSSSPTTAGFSTASPPTSSPSRATARLFGSRATTAITKPTVAGASAPRRINPIAFATSRWCVAELLRGPALAAPYQAGLPARGTSGLLAQHSDQALDLPAIALDHGREFGALCDRHADAVDGDISDLVGAVLVGQVPLDLDRRSTGRADDFARDDRSFGICPAADYLEGLTAIGGQLGAVYESDIVLEQPGKFALLFGGRGLPIPA